MSGVKIIHRRFKDLATLELHDLIKLRIDVFVVEQNCPYPELDGRDTEPTTIHSLAIVSDKIVGYARALAPQPTETAFRIGRVVLAKNHRGSGLARKLMQEIIEQGCSAWPEKPIELSAQTIALGFYQSLGFKEISEEYLEDGIAHIDMRREL